MQKKLLFCALLLVSAVALAMAGNPFVAETADKNPLPNLVPLVRETIPAPSEPQPPLRSIDPPEDIDMTYADTPQINPEDFPSGPKSFNHAESVTDLPMSSAGRWLHSGVIIGNKFFVYGGISTYSDKLLNDMWMYDYKMSRWSQFQRSFVPPFPLNTGRPDDVPAPPAYKDMPSDLAPARPPVPVIEPEYRGIISGVGFANKDPAFTSFVEIDSDISSASLQPSFRRAPGSRGPSPAFRGPASRRPIRSIQASAAAAARRSSAASAHSANAVPEHFLSSAGANGGSPATMDWRSIVGLRPESEGLRDWPAVPTDLWEYDLDTKLWKCILVQSADGTFPAPAPQQRWLHSAVELQGRMVIFGGASVEGKVLGDTWVFDPTTQVWAEAHTSGPRPLPREGHCAVGVGTTMYIFGGISIGFQPFNDIWAYNVVSNSWAEVSANHPMRTPSPRWLHSCAAFSATDTEENMLLYSFGGVGADYVPMNDLNVFDISVGAWRVPPVNPKGSIPPFPRMLHNMVFMGSHLFVFGGIANNIAFEDLHSYDVLTGVWTESLIMGGFPFARGGAAAAVLQPPRAKTPPRPKFDVNMLNSGLKPNYRWDPRYRKAWNDNRFLIVFGGAGIVR